jgi:uncharacterized integral membrane protein
MKLFFKRWNDVKPGGIKMSYELILSIVLAELAVLFIIQNVTAVELRFLFRTLSMSRALLLFLVLSIGIIPGWSLHSYFKRTKTVNMQNKSL